MNRRLHSHHRLSRHTAGIAVAALLLWLSATGCAPAPDPLPLVGPPASIVEAVTLQPVVDGLTRPVAGASDATDRFFVAEKDGLVRLVADGAVRAEPVLDLRDRIATDGSERGLLGIALHPAFLDNGRLFVVYTNLDGDTEIVETVVDQEAVNADSAETRLILFVDQPFGNHNGGQLRFGPDGMLYVGLGDGGAVGDPYDNAQDPGTLLGAILRLDIDAPTPDAAYTIPPDNPFADERNARGEVWALGLRNPWAFSFDRATGDLYIGDVGQEGPEEINFQPAGHSGINYGWPVLEGERCFEDGRCRNAGLQPPAYTYPHSDGCAVVGGHVYRGAAYPALTGTYFFADYCLGTVWALRYDPPSGVWLRTPVANAATPLSAFVEDTAGELYVLAYNDGALLRLSAPK